MTEAFKQAQQRMLDRFGVAADSRFVDVPALEGRAHVLVTGDGPPVVMVNGIGTPGAMWAPLMAKLSGFTLYAVDGPGFGLTDAPPFTQANLKPVAVAFLDQLLDGLGLERAPFVANSMGALWSTWLALEKPARVAAMVYIGAPALILGTSAPFPMRLLSVPAIGNLIMRLDPPSIKQIEKVIAMVKEDFSGLPELPQLLVEVEKLPAYEAAFGGILHALVRLRGARPEMALTAEQLARLTQPVRVIWGEDDPFGSAAIGRRAAEIIPEAEFHLVPGGHAPWVNQAEKVGAIAAPFLREHAV